MRLLCKAASENVGVRFFRHRGLYYWGHAVSDSDYGVITQIVIRRVPDTHALLSYLQQVSAITKERASLSLNRMPVALDSADMINGQTIKLRNITKLTIALRINHVACDVNTFHS